MGEFIFYLSWVAAILAVIVFFCVIYKRIFFIENEENLNNKVKAVECGHETKLKGKVSAFGENVVTKIKPDKNGNAKYCHDCLSDMAILCAWCERPIFIGNPITLYSTRKDDFKVPNHASIYKEDPITLVGCGRTDCADTGADYAGTWIPPGKVKRTPSMIEQSMADLQKGGDGFVVR